MKKNVLFVVDERKMGGVSILFEDIMNNFNIEKYNIDILVLHNNGDYLNNLPKSINVIYGTKYFSGIDYTLKEALKTFNPCTIYHKIKVVLDMKTGRIKKNIIRERKKILKKKYDVEIAFKDGFTALFTIFGDSKKKIHWLHYEYKKTNPNGKYTKLFSEILPKFDSIVAVSEGVKEAFYNAYKIENVKVIENYIDTNKIVRLSKEEGLKLNDKDINFVSVGRLHEMKGYDRLVRIIGSIKKEGKLPNNFKLRIYGDGPLKNVIQKLIIDNELTNNVILMGRTRNPYKEIKNNSLFILPSYYEPFGIVIVEAMTLHVPVLACSNAATSRLIKSKTNGLIVDNNDDALKEGLEYLISNPKVIDKYHNNLSNYEYDNSVVMKQIERELNE